MCCDMFHKIIDSKICIVLYVIHVCVWVCVCVCQIEALKVERFKTQVCAAVGTTVY